MDVLILARAKKVAQELVAAVSGDVDDLEKVVEDLSLDLAALVTDTDVINEDGDIASTLIINRLRQHIWQNEDEALTCEEGTVTLTNTQKFPFNDSRVSVALAKTQKDTKYVVVTDVQTVAGNIGDVTVTDKQVNGFKIGYSGGAASVTVKYYVIGGFDT